MCGYVKSASKAGVFVTVSKGKDARINLANLASVFVEDPVKDFPAGMCVRGKLVSTLPK